MDNEIVVSTTVDDSIEESFDGVMFGQGYRKFCTLSPDKEKELVEIYQEYFEDGSYKIKDHILYKKQNYKFNALTDNCCMSKPLSVIQQEYFGDGDREIEHEKMKKLFKRDNFKIMVGQLQFHWSIFIKQVRRTINLFLYFQKSK